VTVRPTPIGPEAARIIGLVGNIRENNVAKERTVDKYHVKIDEIPSVLSMSSDGIEFIVPGLIASSAVTAITGDAGAGKTTFATALAGHVACGAEFLGRGCLQRPVLILDRENTAPVVQERITRLRIQDGSSLRIWGGWLPDEAPEPGATVILEWIDRCNPKPLIIVDSLIAFLAGDENDAQVVRAFMQQLRNLADAGAAVVVLHHSGKGESTRDYRGSSDFKASIDVGYSLSSFGEGCLDRLRLKAFKTRFVVVSDLILRYSDGEFTADEKPNTVNATVTAQLTELLRTNPGIKSKEFEEKAANARLGWNRARQFLKDGLASGSVRSESGARNVRFHYLVESEAENDLF
jgi:hypothetical protein